MAVLGMICLGSMLGEWTVRVRPPASGSTRTPFPSDSLRAVARLSRTRSPAAPPPSFASSPLAFLSRAPADSLDLLPGIGPVLAARIVDARRSRGSFSTWNDVLAVKGIGPRMVARWQSLSLR
jgi:competence protein ComEA